MSLDYARIMQRVIHRPLLVHPRNAAICLRFLCERQGLPAPALTASPDAALIDARDARMRRNNVATIIDTKGNVIRKKASRFAGSEPLDDGRRPEPFRISGNTGILTVVGELVNRGPWTGSYSGMVSYEGLGHQLSRIGRDPRVKNVILDIDSPGGEAVGFDVAASAVRKLSAEKPVTAVVNGMAASAAYALASGAKRIVTTPTGLAGSIGVVLLHMDFSKQLEAEGVVPTLIYAGEHKADGNPFEALSEEIKSDLQAEVETYYSLFLQTVAEGRGKKTSAKAARETEARTYIGQEAVNARLADDVGTFDDVLADLSRRGARQSQSARSSAMTANTGVNPSAVTFRLSVDDEGTPRIDGFEHGGTTFADANALVASARAEGEKASSKVQLDRISAILADDRSKGRERLCLKIACKSPDMSAEDVLELAAETIAAPAAPSLAQRSAETGADAIDGQPDADRRSSSAPLATDPQSSWGQVISNQNQHTARRARQERKTTALG